MEERLIARLESVARRHQARAIAWQFALGWTLAALTGFGCIAIHREFGWGASLVLPVGFGLWAAACLGLFLRYRANSTDYRAIARMIEQGHPELNGLLLTAVQQQQSEKTQQSYLQHRLLEQALDHSRSADWGGVVPKSRIRLAQGAYVAAFGLFLVALAGLLNLGGGRGMAWTSKEGVVVTPGDTSIERGESLIVLARFGGTLPADVNLVVRAAGESPHSITLVKSLADPVFGGSIPEVGRDLTYRLEYAGGRTRDYKVSVFENPRLERADAVLNFPAYTRLASKRIENTRRISAVEGTRLGLALQLNKPVASASLVAHDAKKTVIRLQVTADKAVASLPEFPLTASQTYDLRLVDRDGRVNPLPTPFVIDVVPDRPPELHVSAPRGDMRPSAIEEVKFAGTLLGDFGVSKYGLAYTLAGGETKFVELGSSVPGKEKRPFDTVLRLEDLGVQPDQLISWYIWADDIGPDGQPRRTNGDLFFAEIRPFDEIFRESKGMQSDDSQADSQGEENKNQRLAELQKQIISATWKLQRDPSNPKYPADAKVVRESQDQALTQAVNAQGEAEDPRTKTLWAAVTREMMQALAHLQQAGKSATELGPALASEQEAYQSLLRLQGRETRVSRGRNGGRGGGGASQRQLDQLDLTQEQNRYETQRKATAAQSPERREQLQVMNRLQELARRQQDVNDRLKEMQTALQEARTDQAREDIRRQLKRLQEEQQQMVADVDELRQRVDQQQNRSSMSDQLRQLDQTRNDVQRAAESTGQGAVAEALASGTRAQRQFQDMRDALHKLNSSQFSDDLRDMRAEAREMARQEEEISQKLTPLASGGPHKRLSEAADDGGPTRALEAQKKRMTDLIDRAKQVSQQAENSEPLLSEKLYDSVRKVAQDDSGTAKEFQQELLNSGLLTRALNDRLTDPSAPEGTRSLDLTSALLKEGYLPQAAEAEQRARAGINDLANGVERAAESVIGDDTSALKLAQSELDTVTDELMREAAGAQGKGPGQGQPQGQGQVAAGGKPAERSPSSGSGSPAEATPGSSLASAPGGDRPGTEQPGNTQPGGGQRQPGPATAAGQSSGAAGRQAPRLAGGGDRGASGGGGDPLGIGNLVNGGGNRGSAAQGSPLTGDGYGSWSDRLRDVEEVVDSPDLRNSVAAARERARLLRQDFTRNLKRPDWAVVQLEIVKPLIEVRNHISDELARRESKDSLVPIDRDPVPNRYAESVRKYYEELGKAALP